MTKIIQYPNDKYELINQNGVRFLISKNEFEEYKAMGKLKVPYITDDYKLIYEIKEYIYE